MFSICQHLFTLNVEMDFTRNGDFTWRASDCEELVGIDQGTKNDTLSKALIHKHIKNNRHAPRGGSPAKSLKQHFNIRKNQES